MSRSNGGNFSREQFAATPHVNQWNKTAQQTQTQQQEQRHYSPLELIELFSAYNQMQVCSVSPQQQQQFFASSANSPSEAKENNGNVLQVEKAGKTSAGASTNVQRPRIASKCGVCTKLCLYFYYNAHCCEGCKQFFRRAMVRQRRYQCIDGANCDIQNGSRCRSCRLDKCLAAGMDWRLIDLAWSTPKLVDYHAYLKQRKQWALRKAGEDASKIERPDSAALQKSVPQQQTANIQPHIALVDSVDAQILDYLLRVEDRHDRVRNAYLELPNDCMDRFECFEELVSCPDNILGIAEQFSANPMPITAMEKAQLLAEIDANNFEHPILLKGVLANQLCCIGVHKAMPAFHRLDLPDQVLLIRQLVVPFTAFCNSYYAAQIGQGSWGRPGVFTAIEVHELRFARDPQLAKLGRRAFCNSVAPFKRMPITRHEFMLMLAILCSHNMSVSGLSTNGSELLYNESVKYTRALLRLLQQRHGNAQGIAKLAECLQLIELSFHATRHYKLFITYLEAFHMRCCVKNTLPRCLMKNSSNAPSAAQNSPCGESERSPVGTSSSLD